MPLPETPTCRCISSWMAHRVEATLWGKQHVTCATGKHGGRGAGGGGQAIKSKAGAMQSHGAGVPLVLLLLLPYRSPPRHPSPPCTGTVPGCSTRRTGRSTASRRCSCGGERRGVGAARGDDGPPPCLCCPLPPLPLPSLRTPAFTSVPPPLPAHHHPLRLLFPPHQM